MKRKTVYLLLSCLLLLCGCSSNEDTLDNSNVVQETEIEEIQLETEEKTNACLVLGCLNDNENGYGAFCQEHSVEIRKLLGTNVDKNSGLSMSVNSAGGVSLGLAGQNYSGKTIKYIKLYVWMENAVGDRIKDEITGEDLIEVELVGPIEYKDTYCYESEVFAYNDNCTKIYVDYATLIYADETSQTGYMYSYAE